MGELRKVSVSFKNTTKDMKVWLRLQQEEEKSDFIKRALRHYIAYLESHKDQENVDL